MKIRVEQPSDYAEIQALIVDAFKSAEHSDGMEQELVAKLRQGTAYLPELTLVAVVEDEIVGHIMISKAHIGELEVLVLAPLAVKVTAQHKGVGSRLIQAVHEKAIALGYAYSFVLGDPAYYSRFGYVEARTLGVDVPADFPSPYFMVCDLNASNQRLHGSLVYAEEFGL